MKVTVFAKFVMEVEFPETPINPEDETDAEYKFLEAFAVELKDLRKGIENVDTSFIPLR